MTQTEDLAQFDPASFEHIPVLLNECLDGLNIDPAGTYLDGTAGSGQWGIDDYASAGVEVSVFTIDKDVDVAYYANYIDRLRAIATNYPKKLIGTFRK